MRIVTLAFCLALAACASSGRQWVRADGRAVGPNAAELDMAACEGQTTKARMMGEPKLAITSAGIRTGTSVVYDGCMAERGWLAR